MNEQICGHCDQPMIEINRNEHRIFFQSRRGLLRYGILKIKKLSDAP